MENETKLGIIGNGQLGSFLFENFKGKYQTTMYDISNGYDICEKKCLIEIVENNNIIINCAAYTNVDKAESEKTLCRKINCDAVKNLTTLIKNKNDDTKFIHISSEYVYGENGITDRPLKETDKCEPCNFYGKTKLYADKFILKNLSKNFLILRPSWLFGPGGHNFIDKLIERLKETKEIKIVDDQLGTITSTLLLYRVIFEYLSNKIEDGLYNICCGQYELKLKPSRMDILLKIIDLLSLSDVKVIPCKTSDFNSAAERQLNSLLDCSKLDKQLRISRTGWDIELVNYISMKNIII